jgi:peptidoglycan/xylan/chitin deacetylase (PgdA/CDA1 family)
MIALTFDNGPTPGVTEGVLDVLEAHDVKATFFAVGRKLCTPEGRSLGQRIVAAGHGMGGHTFTHSQQYGSLADSVLADDLARTSAAVVDAGGDGLLFRPYGAGGVIDDKLMTSFGAIALCDRGYTCVLWNVLPGDWRDAAGWVEPALESISEQHSPVVVLHDVHNAALARLGEFLTRAAELQRAWTQEFPDACVPIRAGRRTTSFDTLQV